MSKLAQAVGFLLLSSMVFSDKVGAQSAPLIVQNQETIFQETIDAVAEATYAEFRSHNPHVDHSQIEVVFNRMVYAYKKSKVWAQLANEYGGKKAIILRFVINTFSNWVAAPFFQFVVHSPLAAQLAFFFPFGSMFAGGYIYYRVTSRHFNLSRKFGRYYDGPYLIRSDFDGDWEDLTKLRQQLLGYDAKYRVTSFVMSEASDEIEKQFGIEVVTKLNSIESIKVPLVTVADMESIVRQSLDGANFLESIYPERAQAIVYVAQLQNYINHDRRLQEELVMKARANQFTLKNQRVFDESMNHRKFLMAVADLRQEVRMMEMDFLRFAKQAKKIAKTESDKEQALFYKKFFNGLNESAEDGFERLYTMEFSYLNTLDRELKQSHAAPGYMTERLDDLVAQFAVEKSKAQQMRREWSRAKASLIAAETQPARLKDFYRMESKLHHCNSSFAKLL